MSAKKVAAKKKAPAKKTTATTKAMPKKVTAKKTAPKKTATPKAPEKQTEPSDVQLAYGMYDGIVLCENPKAFPKKAPYSEKDLALVLRLLSEERELAEERLREVLALVVLRLVPFRRVRTRIWLPAARGNLEDFSS